jgi:hypothetical protein
MHDAYLSCRQGAMKSALSTFLLAVGPRTKMSRSALLCATVYDVLMRSRF